MFNADSHRSTFITAIESTQFSISTGPCDVQDWADDAVRTLLTLRQNGGKLFFIGNGASASISSHFSTDFTKNGMFQAYCLTDPALMTCFANDYSYEDAYKEMLKRYFKPGDALFAISSSGQSKNILRAATLAKEISPGKLFAFSGFSADNMLKKLGDTNVYVPNTEYGPVESAHTYYIHMLIDAICKVNS